MLPSSGVKMLEFLHPAWSHIGFRNSLEAINGRWCAVQGPSISLKYICTGAFHKSNRIAISVPNAV